MPKIGYLVDMNRGWDAEEQEDWQFYKENDLPTHYRQEAKRIIYWELEDES